MDGFQISIKMNPYLFGCLILMFFQLITFVILKLKKLSHNIREFWWASISCSLLGITEPLFVPEYWAPPSILKFYRWDFESFVFCFAVGGLAAVLTELPKAKKALFYIDYILWYGIRSIFVMLRRIILGTTDTKDISVISYSRVALSKSQVRIENMLLITFFAAVFGATAHFGLNIIYDVAIVCVATAGFIWWRRPRLKWQILGGGISFTLIYTVVLTVTDNIYPNFFEHWNMDDLTGLFLAGAPI